MRGKRRELRGGSAAFSAYPTQENVLKNFELGPQSRAVLFFSDARAEVLHAESVLSQSVRNVQEKNHKKCKFCQKCFVLRNWTHTCEHSVVGASTASS